MAHMNNPRSLSLLVITLFATALIGLACKRVDQQPPASPGVSVETPEVATSTPTATGQATTTEEKWSKYTNEELGFSFEYPESWGEVSVVTRESVVEDEKPCNYEGPCPPPILRAVGWDNEKKLLESNPPDGEVDCTKGQNWKSICLIESLKNRKVLVKYIGRTLGGRDINKYHIFYINNTRIEIKPEPYDLGNDPSESKFIGAENIDWVYDKLFSRPE